MVGAASGVTSIEAGDETDRPLQAMERARL